MSKRCGQMTLFDRCRRASALRVLFLATTLLASQNSLACAFEDVYASQQTNLSIGAAAIMQDDVPAVSEEHSGDDCCGLCLNCAQCGGCCSSAVTLRASDTQLAPVTIAYANISFATAAPTLWKQPALLRPPINAA